MDKIMFACAHNITLESFTRVSAAMSWKCSIFFVFLTRPETNNTRGQLLVDEKYIPLDVTHATFKLCLKTRSYCVSTQIRKSQKNCKR